MTENEITGRPEEMFGTLLASRPGHSTSRAARSTAGALVLHAGIIGGLVWATMAVGSEVTPEEEVTLIEIPPEAPPPPPPPPPPRPVAPPAVNQPVVPRGFQTLTPPDIILPDIPPPQLGVMVREEDFSGLGVQGGRADGDENAPPDDPSLAPVFTPFTVRPQLRNQAEVSRALERTYPPVLRDAGIGGTSVMWFFIDETGKVINTKLFESSGYDALDEAAETVANIMEFSPALNREQAVQVWVQIPITFQSR